jgi:hypothetical protein
MNTSKIDPVLGAKMGEVVSQTKNESDRKYDFHGPPLPLGDKVRRQRASIDGNILEAGLGRFQRLAKKQRVFQHIPKLIRGDLFIDGVDNQSIGSNSPPPNLLKLNSKCSPEEFRRNTASVGSSSLRWGLSKALIYLVVLGVQQWPTNSQSPKVELQ